MKKKIILTTFIFIIILLVLFSINKTNKKKVDTKKEVIKTSTWYTPNGTNNLIDIYYYEVDDTLSFIYINDSKDFLDNTYKYKNTYKCNTNSCNVYSYMDDKIIIKDDDYVIYDASRNKAKKLNLPDAMYNDIKLLSKDGKDYGLGISNINNLYAFYSLEKEVFTTEFKYSNIFYLETDGLSKGYVSTVINDNGVIKYQIINYAKGDVVNESDSFVGMVGNKDNVYFYTSSDNEAKIYDHKFNLLFGEKTFGMFSVTELGNIIIKDSDNTFSMYNKEGVMVKKSKEYKDILMMVKDLVVVIDMDGYLKVVNCDGNVLVKFDKLNNFMFDEGLSRMHFIDENNVLYIYINDLSEESIKTIKYYYYLETKEKKKLVL